MRLIIRVKFEAPVAIIFQFTQRASQKSFLGILNVATRVTELNIEK